MGPKGVGWRDIRAEIGARPPGPEELAWNIHGSWKRVPHSLVYLVDKKVIFYLEAYALILLAWKQKINVVYVVVVYPFFERAATYTHTHSSVSHKAQDGDWLH